MRSRFCVQVYLEETVLILAACGTSLDSRNEKHDVIHRDRF
jgi:hypothetical protein